MEALQLQCQTMSSNSYFMNTFSPKFRATLPFTSAKIRCLCTLSIPNLKTQELIEDPPKSSLRSSSSGRAKATTKVSDAQLKEKWLDSLSCPFPEKLLISNGGIDSHQTIEASEWVVGIDPDLSGALAILKTNYLGSVCSAQVFDSPHLKVLVGKRTRKRLDAKSIVQLLQSLDAPVGTRAYIEQSIPYPQDGKQGWWSGGFGYGLWIGILVASGFSVVPVPSLVWKNEFKLSGNGSTKDDSRELASTFFPSLSSELKRKKDHGRAEALLIAAYGKGMKRPSELPCISEPLTP